MAASNTPFNSISLASTINLTTSGSTYVTYHNYDFYNTYDSVADQIGRQFNQGQDLPEVLSYRVMDSETKLFYKRLHPFAIIDNNLNKVGKAWKHLNGVKKSLSKLIVDNPKELLWENLIPSTMLIVETSSWTGVNIRSARALFPTENKYKYGSPEERLRRKFEVPMTWPVNKNKVMFVKDKLGLWRKNGTGEVICDDELDVFMDITAAGYNLADSYNFAPIDSRVLKE